MRCCGAFHVKAPLRCRIGTPHALNIPAWLFDRWSEAYGEAEARRIALASLCEAPLDISVKRDPELWAERLGGTVLPTGSVRLAAGGRIEDLAGLRGGCMVGAGCRRRAPRSPAWRRLRPKSVADLCAAPGGKTAELAAAGADVTAVELSAGRLARLRANLERLQLQADLVEADAATWAPGKLFDAVLLDAPCTSTGTIRRHPDILHLKRPEDVAALAALQSRLIDNAARLVKPGGMLVYCTCSLEPEEGPAQIARLLSRAPEFARVPIAAGECGIPADWLTADGDLRTLPFHLPHDAKRAVRARRILRRAPRPPRVIVTPGASCAQLVALLCLVLRARMRVVRIDMPVCCHPLHLARASRAAEGLSMAEMTLQGPP